MSPIWLTNSSGGYVKRLLSRRCSFRLFLSLFLLAFVLTSCDSSVASVPNTPVAATVSAATPGLEPAYSFDKSQTLSGLFLKLNGFVCTEGPFLSNLTVATKRASYDVGSAQIIQNYLQLLDANSNVTNAPPYARLAAWIPPRPPQELQWMPGSTTCTGTLGITNTTQTSIEVQRFGIRLTAAPENNSYHYQRIPIHFQCPGCGGGPLCLYTASVILNAGVIGSSFDSPLTSTDSVGCPLPLNIPALSSTEVSITFRDAHTRNLIYTGLPVLTIAGASPIALSALATRFTFTHTNKLPCYQFQGNVFVPCSH